MLNKNLFKRNPVIAIPAFFDDDEELVSVSGSTGYLDSYLQHLATFGGKIIMTTAGTTNFNLLSREEAVGYGVYLANHWQGTTIVGVPELPTKRMIKQIEYLNRVLPDTSALMFRYPERYYRSEGVISYFKDIMYGNERSFFIHADPIRSGISSGHTDYWSQEILKLKGMMPNFVGIKEETSDLMKAMNFVAELPEDFITIAAGGSMTRHWATQSTTFLSGVGNLRPDIEVVYLKAGNDYDSGICHEIIKDVEKPFFDVMMLLGWHSSLREALHFAEFCPGARRPIPKVDECDMDEIHAAVDVLMTKGVSCYE